MPSSVGRPGVDLHATGIPGVGILGRWACALSRPLRRGPALLLAGMLLLAGCGPREVRAPVEVPIYFTCDTRGRLEPCGCFEGQFGGLTRLKTVLDAAPEAQTLRLDVGDALAGSEDFDLIEYRYMQRAFAAMHYDALNLGHREAQLSIAQLRDLKRTATAPMISANLLDKSTGLPVFDSWRVVERGGYRIAIIGVLDPRGAGDSLGEGVLIGDMASAITRCVQEVRPKADAVILLAFANEEALAKLAEQFYEATAILGGKVRQPSQELKQENRSLIYFVTNESRALGKLRIRLAAGESPKPVSNEIQLLHDKIPQARAFRELAQAYRDEVRRTRLNIDHHDASGADAVPGVSARAEYVGSERCVTCHVSAAAVWSKSSHARAFDALIARGSDADPKCIGCHTIGFGSPSGYRREFGAEKRVHVGCESCHGPGSMHVDRREGNRANEFLYRPLDAGDCVKCHHGEFSRPFDWNEFWPPIKHGKENSTPAQGVRAK